MAEEVGIVMTLYDRVSPTLKSIAGSSRAFDKSLDELEASLKAYDKAQTELVGHSANLKKAIAETDVPSCSRLKRIPFTISFSSSTTRTFFAISSPSCSKPR